MKPIDANSDKIKIKGHKGTWYVIDKDSINGKNYFLLEHEKYSDVTPNLIVDDTGELILDDVYNGFDDLIEHFALEKEIHLLTKEEEQSITTGIEYNLDSQKPLTENQYRYMRSYIDKIHSLLEPSEEEIIKYSKYVKLFNNSIKGVGEHENKSSKKICKDYER